MRNSFACELMTPFLLIPGLNCDGRVYAPATTVLWPHGPVTVANHLQGVGLAGIAANILRDAPPRFALAGFSMGGYLSFEILRQAPERVLKLALIDTNPWTDKPDAAENRRRRIEQTRAGKFGLVTEQSFTGLVHPDNAGDSGLYSIHRAMAEACGPEAYVRHQEAIIARPDCRPLLGAIGVPTLVVVGEADAISPVSAATEMSQGIAGSTLVVVPRAGHMAPLENGIVVNRALAHWAAA
jgi:pimeloyl-ACP methyl ester carboxylesterase